MVRIMRIFKILIVASAILVLTLALTRGIEAPSPSTLQTFFSKDDYAGISIRVEATNETIPAENLTIRIWINCTAAGVKVDCLNLSIYGFIHGQEKTQLNTTNVVTSTSFVFNHTYEYYYDVFVPRDVWGAAHAQMLLKYFIFGSSFEYDPGFPITVIRNIDYEKLQEDFKNLTENYSRLYDDFLNLTARFESLNGTYQELCVNHTQLQQNYTLLNGTYQELYMNNEQLQRNYTLLNGTYQELYLNNTQLQGNYTLLNGTYQELCLNHTQLQQNYDALKETVNQLDNTRQLAVILGATTVFLVATTLYLMTRKPKEY
jgi:hypothetical protein